MTFLGGLFVGSLLSSNKPAKPLVDCYECIPTSIQWFVNISLTIVFISTPYIFCICAEYSSLKSILNEKVYSHGYIEILDKKYSIITPSGLARFFLKKEIAKYIEAYAKELNLKRI